MFALKPIPNDNERKNTQKYLSKKRKKILQSEKFNEEKFNEWSGKL